MPNHLFDGSNGEWVWIENTDMTKKKDNKNFTLMRACTITKITDDRIELAVQCGDPGPEEAAPEPAITVRDDGKYKLHRMAANCVDGVDNMIELGDLHEGSLLHNLRMRFRRDVIYTYVGQILVAVNPYTDLGYTKENWMVKYKRQGMDNKELPPHPFAVGDHVYNMMMRSIEGVGDGKPNQSVVISGESGAGKTVTTGHVLQYLTWVTGKKSEVGEQILCSGEMLETFGNAKTTRNNNSSRFGKFIEVLFNDEGQIIGADVKHYLLEKSRVTTQSLGERNYHAFYHIFVGWPSAHRSERWMLTDHPEDYAYLNQSGVTLDPSNIDDKSDNEITRRAMDKLHFPREMQDTIWDVVAAILHIGNIKFDPKPGDASAIHNPEEVAHVAALLKLPPKQLERSLLLRMLELPGGKTVEQLFIPSMAVDNAGALSKALYAGMFDWIMFKINEVLRGDNKVGAGAKHHFIGVLDIFGFEHFTNKPRPIPPGKFETYITNNHFEQFCINFANEKLQNFFNLNIFEQERAVYRAEGIPLEDIRFKNNDLCIDLIQGKGGILDVLNEISKPKPPRDWTHFRKELLDTFCQGPNWQPNPEIDVDMRADRGQYMDKITAVSKWKANEYDFIIHHYAGPVQYTAGSRDSDACADMVTKNKDKLSPDLRELIEHSENPLVAHIFEYAVGRNIKDPTVGKIFAESLNDLIGRLSSTDAIFIRTIKPNNVKKKRVFEDLMVLEQLRCAGMLETIKIRKMGYPRKAFPEDFVKEYQILVNMDEIKGMDSNAQCMLILERFAVQTAESERLNGALYRMGLTKIFFKDRCFMMLEREKDKRLRILQKLKEVAALLLRSMYRTHIMQVKLPQIEAEYRKVQKWNEEKLRRMRETGKSADEVEREMLEEMRAEEENRYKQLVLDVVGPVKKEATFALEGIDESKDMLRELLNDNDDPAWTDEETTKFRARMHQIEELEMAMHDAVEKAEKEYSVQKPNLIGYDQKVVKAAHEAVKALKQVLAANSDQCLKEKSARSTVKQKEIARKEREVELEEQRRREEEARKAREKALEEERARIRKIEQEEAERRAALEEKQRQTAMEIERRHKKRAHEKNARESKIEERRAAFRLMRAEMAKQEKLGREQREFEQMTAQQEQDFVERAQQEDREFQRKKKEAEDTLKHAQTNALKDTRVLYGALPAMVKYVGTLPFAGAGPWIGIELEQIMGHAPGNNGVCMGERFFECRQDQGLFVRGEMLHILEDEPIKHGALVNWNGHLGRVRFMGKVHFEAGENWVGVELEQEVGKNDGTVQGRQYFRCRKNRGVLTRSMNVKVVRQWSPSFVDTLTQNYIIKNDLDFFVDNEEDLEAGAAERELVAMEMAEAEQRLRERYGTSFRINEFDGDKIHE